MEMRERLKDKPQKMQRDDAHLREERSTRWAYASRSWVQIPVFIALYWVLLSSVEMRNAPWINWIATCRRRIPFFILPSLMTASSLLPACAEPGAARPDARPR